MGCDISVYVERRFNGEWEEWDWLPGAGVDHDGYPEERCYPLFAALADVRNMSSFEEVDPWFAGRGMPDGLSGDDIGWCAEHSFTYATAAELLAAPWDAEYKFTGFVNSEDYDPDDAVPQRWCAGVGGEGVIKVTEADYLAMGQPDDGRWIYILKTWTGRPLVDCGFKLWLDRVVAPEADLIGAKNIRVVVGFDS